MQLGVERLQLFFLSCTAESPNTSCPAPPCMWVTLWSLPPQVCPRVHQPTLEGRGVRACPTELLQAQEGRVATWEKGPMVTPPFPPSLVLCLAWAWVLASPEYFRLQPSLATRAVQCSAAEPLLSGLAETQPHAPADTYLSQGRGRSWGRSPGVASDPACWVGQAFSSFQRSSSAQLISCQ